MKKIIYAFSFAMIAFSSCKMSQTVISINSGGINNLESSKIENLIFDNATFVSYSKNNSTVNRPSNEINFTVYKNLPVKTDVKVNAGLNIELPKFRRERIKKERRRIKKEKIKIKRIRIRTEKSKPNYAHVNISKSFYKTNYFNLISAVYVLPILMPGFSLIQKSYFITEKCKHDGKCSGAEHTVNKKILIETDIIVKRDEIKGNVLIFENLPDAITIDKYKIKTKRGKSLISEVKYENKTLNEEKYHQFTIIPKKGSFTKKCRVWVKLYVTIKPTISGTSKIQAQVSAKPEVEREGEGWIKDENTGCKYYSFSNCEKRYVNWSSTCLDGYANGIGKLECYEDSILYFTYTGQVSNGKLNGQGTGIWASGTKYEGEWKDGRKNGQGTCTWTSGTKYEGEWKDDKFVGTSKIQAQTSAKSEGEGWIKDENTGCKYYSFSNCEKRYVNWSGECIDGYANGVGKLECYEDSILFFTYTGEVRNGILNGQGTGIWASGTKYEGEWKDGRKNGQGTCTWTSGTKYEGKWKDDKFQGSGK